ncbi:hypothetical protein FHG66_02985 [Rubellimicrobium rubrum]|uniref:DUF3179 domain-containing protein n=1 Tax=Rubellimicrobium rubrum TaxID=2585369 RepID=A0A5C4N4P6_9RHOB|nr:DUF6544 family protein [Rubellimicrobium rubrum]TNC52511.1 hypothetical protein FHG66_02985 [Rubellimicrobium rubrum]
MKTRILVSLAALATIGVATAALALRPGASLSAEFERRLATLEPGPEGPPLTQADLAHLPAPVQRWLRRAGVVGHPPATLVHTTFDATLYRAPGGAGMSGLAHQVDVLDPRRRLYFMTTWMNGLPVAVLHDYEPDMAGMQVRAARLVDVVNLSGADFARIETVTFLNDLCAFAPSALVRPEFAWTPIDDTRAAVAYTVGPHTVTATLVVNEAGDLVDFISDDRADVSADGSPKAMRWTTPLSEHRDLDGRRVPGRGEAIWHREDGPFTYGRFTVREVTFNRRQEG